MVSLGETDPYAAELLMVGLTLSDFVLVRRTLHVGVMELHFIPTLTLVSRVSDSPRHWHHIPPSHVHVCCSRRPVITSWKRLRQGTCITQQVWDLLAVRRQ